MVSAAEGNAPLAGSYSEMDILRGELSPFGAATTVQAAGDGVSSRYL